MLKLVVLINLFLFAITIQFHLPTPWTTRNKTAVTWILQHQRKIKMRKNQRYRRSQIAKGKRLAFLLKRMCYCYLNQQLIQLTNSFT